MNPFQGVSEYGKLVQSNLDKLGGLFTGGGQGEQASGLGSFLMGGGLVGKGLSALFGKTDDRMAGEGLGLSARELTAMTDGDRDTRRQFLIEILGPERTKPLRERDEEKMERRMFFVPPSDTFV